jgi:hypothetical protein
MNDELVETQGLSQDILRTLGEEVSEEGAEVDGEDSE